MVVEASAVCMSLASKQRHGITKVMWIANWRLGRPWRRRSFLGQLQNSTAFANAPVSFHEGHEIRALSTPQSQAGFSRIDLVLCSAPSRKSKWFKTLRLPLRWLDMIWLDQRRSVVDRLGKTGKTKSLPANTAPNLALAVPSTPLRTVSAYIQNGKHKERPSTTACTHACRIAASCTGRPSVRGLRRKRPTDNEGPASVCAPCGKCGVCNHCL